MTRLRDIDRKKDPKRYKQLARNYIKMGDSPRAAVYAAIGFCAWIDQDLGLPLNALERRALQGTLGGIRARRIMKERRRAKDKS
jgi:hypothetical protein